MNLSLQAYLAMAPTLVEVTRTEPSSGAGRGPQSIAIVDKRRQNEGYSIYCKVSIGWSRGNGVYMISREREMKLV